MTTDTIKALRDALTEIATIDCAWRQRDLGSECLRWLDALAADASEDAPDSGWPQEQIDKLDAVLAQYPAARPAPLAEQSTSQHAGAPNNVRPAPVGAVQASEGWQLVPKVPTVDMHNAAALAGLCGAAPTLAGDGRIEWSPADASAVYRAMLAAAPAAPIAKGAEND